MQLNTCQISVKVTAIDNTKLFSQVKIINHTAFSYIHALSNNISFCVIDDVNSGVNRYKYKGIRTELEPFGTIGFGINLLSLPFSIGLPKPLLPIIIGL